MELKNLLQKNKAKDNLILISSAMLVAGILGQLLFWLGVAGVITWLIIRLREMKEIQKLEKEWRAKYEERNKVL